MFEVTASCSYFSKIYLAIFMTITGQKLLNRLVFLKKLSLQMISGVDVFQKRVDREVTFLYDSRSVVFVKDVSDRR